MKKNIYHRISGSNQRKQKVIEQQKSELAPMKTKIVQFATSLQKLEPLLAALDTSQDTKIVTTNAAAQSEGELE